ncbi:MAG: murein hydrolase activator EnvC family protein, partial [Chloroflexota bacterium]
LRALYKFTRTSPLEQLLAARDFSDALRRVAMMQAITRVDNRLLGQLRTEYGELLASREALQRKQEEAVALRDEIDQQRRALADRRADQAAALVRAQQDQGEAESGLTLFEQQVKAEQANIVALQAQYQAELEEIERQRREAERRAEEQRRLEAQRRASAQATATAQARAQAARSSGSARPAPVQGAVATGDLAPSTAGFIWPVANPVVTTELGGRSPGQRYHTGIDLAQRLYSPVRAAADGIVIESGLAVPGKPSQSYGMRVSIAHPQGIATLYAHLDDRSHRPTVKAGDRVQRGQVIGYIGMTGITTGPHLHFEVLRSGSPQNPRHYLPK